jgi:lambda repressor-like predicted transcriptional regulator
MTDERRPTNRKFRLILGALAVVAVVSGGAAYAASQDNSPQARSQAIVNDAAGTLGVDPSKLSDALKKALENQVDAQVTAGTLTQGQADAIKKRIDDGTQPIFGGPGFGGGPRGHFGRFGHGGPGFGFGFGFGGPGLTSGIADVATYLGLKPADLATQLRSGKSLADIAKAQGKTVDGLKAAITDAMTKQFDAAVTAGKLTKDQETKLLADLTSRLDDIVNGVHEPGRPGGFGRGGPGFAFGGPGLMAGIADVATYLGLKPADLATQLRSGKSLADIATAQGKTVDGLKTAITDAATKQLDAAVTANKLTKDQETKLLAGLASQLDDLVNGAHTFGFGFGFRHGHGHGGWQGHDDDKGAAPSDGSPPPAAPADLAPAPATA